MAKGLANEWSHDRVRPVTRCKDVPALPVAKDPTKVAAGRLGAAARWHRQDVAQGNGEAPDGTNDGRSRLAIGTLDPAKAPAWIRPHIEAHAPYVAALLEMLAGRDVLFPLAGSVANAHAVHCATLALAVKAKNPRRRAALMSDARAWLKEHRTALATLSALAGGMSLPEPQNPHAALAAALAIDPTRDAR